MMQKLRLSIPEPCHENWHNMSPTDQGRFCNACAKEVVDLSMMTDRQVLHYFSTITDEKVCGRALSSQLNTDISVPKDPKKRLFWYWNYIVMFFMFFSKTSTSKAQNSVQTVAVSDINNALAGKVGGVAINKSRIIRGKVIDKEGTPVPFAMITGIGRNKIISADANGEFTIRIDLINPYIKISGGGFISKSFTVSDAGIQQFILVRDANSVSTEVVFAVGGIIRNSDEPYTPTVMPKHVAVLEVKDNSSGLPINKAEIIISGRHIGKRDTVFTDKKGKYRVNKVDREDSYLVKVKADGYEANEFFITGQDFNNREKVWEVLLRKTIAAAPATHIGMGAVSTISDETQLLYVVDGKIIPNAKDINVDDIENVTLLQPSAAAAIYGTVGAGGAMVITTKKLTTKNLDTVIVSATVCNKRSLVTGGMVKGVPIKRTRIIDSVKTLFAGPSCLINIYPNPVKRGSSFALALKLKHPGNYNIDIIDATGRIVLQKQTNILSKEYMEQVQTDSRWGSGVYFIHVFDNNNKPISKLSFIVK